MKSKTTAGIFALVFGGLGVHRFYLGQKGLGILYLLFVWTFIPTIIAMIDGIVFLTQDEDKFNRKYNTEYWAMQQQQQQQQHHYHHYRQPPPQYNYADTPNNPPPRPAYAEEAATPKKDPFQISADRKYADYDFTGAIQDYRRSLNVDPRQADVHFKLACLYSIHEDTDTSLYHLSQALEHGYFDFDEMEKHDHLAYLRSTPEFLAFKSNGYRIPASTPESAEPESAQPADTLELSDDLITRIERLAKLKEDGILSEDAFKREKAKILRS
ncbi:NINE protein [Neolewinella litorea]|uniref:NINE protein n=1 Tax=Neolewinella litorea TaxID=2562452 RepID=A0A4S4NQI5_9BACT|nr:NINE protein [Neolewinella litorea]THH40608.1 NINE protein [Neolewinella litorea]